MLDPVSRTHIRLRISSNGRLVDPWGDFRVGARRSLLRQVEAESTETNPPQGMAKTSRHHQRKPNIRTRPPRKIPSLLQNPTGARPSGENFSSPLIRQQPQSCVWSNILHSLQLTPPPHATCMHMIPFRSLSCSSTPLVQLLIGSGAGQCTPTTPTTCRCTALAPSAVGTPSTTASISSRSTSFSPSCATSAARWTPTTSAATLFRSPAFPEFRPPVSIIPLPRMPRRSRLVWEGVEAVVTLSLH